MAIVLYRQPAALDLAFPADTAQLRPVRAQLRGWLEGSASAPHWLRAPWWRLEKRWPTR